MIVWDRGTYKLAEGTNPTSEIAHGKIKFILRGKKLSGIFNLVKIRARDGSENAWLLIKDNDASSKAGWDPERYPESVKTGRTLQELAQSSHARRWISNRPASSKRR